MSDATRVKGVVESMRAFATAGKSLGLDLQSHATAVTGAMAEFAIGTEGRFAVSGDGGPLLALGRAVVDLDDFVGDVADRLATADSGRLTTAEVAQVIADHMPVGVVLDRLAGDAVLNNLSTGFDAIDKIKSKSTDGRISLNDLKKAAASSDPTVAATAKWLLAHPEVIKAIDGGSGGPVDNLITKDDLKAYAKQRLAFQVLSDNIAVFDSEDPSKADGKVSRADVERVARTTNDPNLKAAAEYLLADPEAIPDISRPDYVAGRWDLAKTAKDYSEPTVPLPPKERNLAAKVVCGVAGFYSYAGWIDLVAAPSATGAATQIGPTVGGPLASAGAKKAESALAKATLKTTAKVLAPPTPVTLIATGVDLVCRATEGSNNGASVKDKPAPEPAKKDMTSKTTVDGREVYTTSGGITPYMDGNGVPVAP